MGLDMYLNGENFFTHEHPNRQLKPFEKSSEQYRLAYWRKHPNLHGFIVQTFADGVDECQEIELSAKQINQIIEAIKKRVLPETTGFFFGVSESDDEQVARDAKVFEDALTWLTTDEPNVWKSISYRASW